MSGKKKPRPVRGRREKEATGDPDESGSRKSRSRASAPTPVRDLMGGASPPTEQERSEPSPPPRVELEVDDESWVVELAGRTRSGTSPDSGAPLLLLRFRKSGGQAASEGEADGAPSRDEREAWAVSHRLSDLSRVQLAELLAGAKPVEHEGPD